MVVLFVVFMVVYVGRGLFHSILMGICEGV